MPNNLTDAEVKKALECCSTYHDVSSCKNCPLDGKCEPNMLEQYALDLINRKTIRLRKVEHQLDDALKMGEVINAEYRWLDQESDILKADVENLNRMCDEVNAENESLKAEVERLNNNISAMATTLSTSARATRHEAYKEFADELARRLGYAFLSKHSCVLDIMENLLNELVVMGND